MLLRHCALITQWLIHQINALDRRHIFKPWRWPSNTSSLNRSPRTASIVIIYCFGSALQVWICSITREWLKRASERRTVLVFMLISINSTLYFLSRANNHLIFKYNRACWFVNIGIENTSMFLRTIYVNFIKTFELLPCIVAKINAQLKFIVFNRNLSLHMHAWYMFV